MDAWVLHEVMRHAGASLLAGIDGSPAEAEQAYLEAAMAAPDAFPPGALADALNLVLGAVGATAQGAAA